MNTFILAVMLTMISASPYRPYPGHRHYYDHQHGHQHGHCSHGELPMPRESPVVEKYPFIRPVIVHFENGLLAPNQMREIQNEINSSVQKGIQAWNRKEGIPEGPGVPDSGPGMPDSGPGVPDSGPGVPDSAPGDPLDIDIRYSNSTAP